MAASDQRVHTNVSNLRGNLARAGGPRPRGYVIQTGGRYRLDPTTVSVDLWELTELLRHADHTTGPARIDALRAACLLYTGPLADGHDYEWIEPIREQLRRRIVTAHHSLAAELDDPAETRTVIASALNVDPYDERTYQLAMRQAQNNGDTETVRALLRQLTSHLADIDAKPSQNTIDLVTTLTR